MLQIRKAANADLNRIMEIYRIAQDFMIATGNPGQWGHFYPEEALIRQDIEEQICHVICEDELIHGVFALCTGEDPTYGRIYEGAWPNNEPYLTIHRVAGDGEVHGLVKSAADYAKNQADNVRIDTYKDNLIMQRQIEKNGFRQCGIIHLENGSPRIAYQWTRKEKAL